MASNEHKNLQDANRHNPLGFENADNNTILTKGNGTPGLKDGNLEWTAKSGIKVDNFSLSGYCTVIENYQYAEPQSYGQSPYDINQDYTSATISSSTTVAQKKFFRIGFGSTQAGIIKTGMLQVAGNTAEALTVALVYYVPSSTLADAYPVVLLEKGDGVGLSSDNKVNSYSLAASDFALTEIPSGAHIFLMVKGVTGTASPLFYVNLTVQVGYEK